MKKILPALILIIIILLSGCDIADSFTADNSTLQNVPAPTGTSDVNHTQAPTETPTDNVGSDGICSVHTDINNDGICDTCDEYVIIILDFYAINDLHGKFSDTNDDEGVDELTTYLENAYKNDDYHITLSSGDMWQGGSESNLTKGRIITEWMNHIDTVSMTLGNHEFDWGEEYINANATLAQFPFLAINIYDKSTDERVDFCAPSVVVERGGIQIGIIGAIGDCYSSIAPDNTKNIYFKVDDELTELVKAESQRLRSEGVDYIVYSLHDGYTQNKSGVSPVTSLQLSSYYDAELSEGGYVDLVFEGHTHKNYVLRDTYGVYHLQDGGDNRGISHAEISINIANMNTSVITAEFVEDDTYFRLEGDDIVEQLRQKYKDEISVGERILGYNKTYRNSDYLRQLTADLYYQKGLEIWGEEYDIILGGGFTSIRSPYHLEAGYVKYSQLQSLFPFDNQLVLCTVKGYDLKKRFINTSNSNYFVCYNESIVIEDNKTYYIVVDTYTSTYAPNNLTEVQRYNAELYARDLLAEYISNGGMG